MDIPKKNELMISYKMSHNEYISNLIKNLEINKEQNDIVNFIKNIFDYYNYIYVNIPYLRNVINQHLIKYNLLLKMNDSKLSSDLLKSFNYKNDKIDNLFNGGNINKIKELQQIQIREQQYIRHRIADHRDINNKIRRFLKLLYELKINNPNYNDNSKYQDLKYMDSITFILNAKNLYKMNPVDYNKTYGKYEKPLVAKHQETLGNEIFDIDIKIPYFPDYSNLTIIDDDINLEDVISKLNITYEKLDFIISDNDQRWGQIYTYNNYKEYIEPIPFVLQDLDTKCCCNDNKYFENSTVLSSIYKAKETYKNEMEFLKKFIYNTSNEIFMTIFDKRRQRCGKCLCCTKKKT